MSKTINYLAYRAIHSNSSQDIDLDLVSVYKLVDVDGPIIRFYLDIPTTDSEGKNTFADGASVVKSVDWRYDDEDTAKWAMSALDVVLDRRSGSKYPKRVILITVSISLAIVLVSFSVLAINGVKFNDVDLSSFTEPVFISALASVFVAFFIVTYLSANKSIRIDTNDGVSLSRDVRYNLLLKEIAELRETANRNGGVVVQGPAESGDKRPTTTPVQKVRNSRHKEVFNDISNSRERIFREVAILERRAVVNLAIGGLLAVFAIGVLFYAFGLPMQWTIQKPDMTIMIHHYLSRASIVIFVEIFAFFFLRLYRNNLGDIKYYQNELSNIEARYIALKTALEFEDDLLIKETIQALLKTERNFILKKGETTVPIEAYKYQDQADETFLDGVKWMAQTVFGSIEPMSPVTRGTVKSKKMSRTS